MENLKVEIICSNKFGTLYRTSEGWHINGNKTDFINNLKIDLTSNDLLARICAEDALNLIKHNQEV